MTDKIAAEVAEAEFDRFTEEMDLDVDPAHMDAEDKTAFEGQKRRIVTAISNGHLVINENGEPVYTPHRPNSKHKEAITFHERSGADLMAQDKGKKGHDVAKTYAIMASMTRLSPATFSGLVSTDIKVCEALFALLMA